VWTFRDVWAGAGWGITDSDGLPKPAFWHLKRAWAKRSVHLTDEGLDGVGLHVVNDGPEPLEARAEVVMLREGRTPVGNATSPLRVAAHTTLGVSVDALLGRFTDATHAYNFGPPKQDVVAVRLVGADGRVISEDAYFPAGHGLAPQLSASVRTRVEALDGGHVAVTLVADAFLQSVAVTSPGFTPDDNYFHLVPGWEKRIVFTRAEGAGEFRADFDALNHGGTIAVRGVGSQGSQMGANGTQIGANGD
jgi:beta-mannosidase